MSEVPSYSRTTPSLPIFCMEGQAGHATCVKNPLLVPLFVWVLLAELKEVASLGGCYKR